MLKNRLKQREYTSNLGPKKQGFELSTYTLHTH